MRFEQAKIEVGNEEVENLKSQVGKLYSSIEGIKDMLKSIIPNKESNFNPAPQDTPRFQ